MIANARRIDLHMHSTRSDGCWPPAEVLARCAASGLDLVALTDHDLVADLPVGEHAIGGRRLHLLGAAEMSGLHQGHEYHLLVYFPGEIPGEFREFCRAQARQRVVRYETAITKLGLDRLPPPDDTARQGERSLTRHHLARALVTAGHARDLHDAFRRFVGEGTKNVPQVAIPFVDLLRVAREHGGTDVLGASALVAVREHVATFAAAGLQGLEGMRPSLNGVDRRFFRTVAKQHGLFLTAGSDWHGWYDADLGLFHADYRELGPFFDALLAA